MKPEGFGPGAYFQCYSAGCPWASPFPSLACLPIWKMRDWIERSSHDRNLRVPCLPARGEEAGGREVSGPQTDRWGRDVLGPQALLPAARFPSALSFGGLLARQKPSELLLLGCREGIGLAESLGPTGQALLQEAMPSWIPAATLFQGMALGQIALSE